MAESPKFSRLKRNRGRGTRLWRPILDRKWKYGRFAHAQWKIRNITLIYGWIAKFFAPFRKSGSGNRMVTSDFSPEVEIRPFCACAMKNTQYSRYLWLNRRNFRVLKEIGAEEHDVDVRFFTGSEKTAVSRMRNASGHNYWNRSFIMDMAMGKIPRSTERISSLYYVHIS